MPIYEYECGACQERTEFIQKFSEAPKRKCPACGKQKLKRLISAAAFHLKGDGWYVTDFRDKGKKDKDKKKDNGSTEGSTEGSDASSSSKSSDASSKTADSASSDSSSSSKSETKTKSSSSTPAT